MKIVIKNLKRNQYTSKRTNKPFTVVKFQNEADGEYYGAFAGKWNEDWADGKEMEIPDDRIKITESNGYTNRNIEAPPEARRGGGVDITPIMTEISLIKAAIKIMDGRLKTIIENQNKQLSFTVQGAMSKASPTRDELEITEDDLPPAPDEETY